MANAMTRRDIPAPLLKKFPDMKKWSYKRIVTVVSAYNLGIALMDQAWKNKVQETIDVRKTDG